MFIGKMVTQPIPSRIFALYNLVASTSEQPLTKDALKEMMEPSSLRTDVTSEKTSYFSIIYTTATQELNLIDSRDNTVILVNPEQRLSSMSDLRSYTIQKMESFREGNFYKTTKTIYLMNEEIYQYKSLTDHDFMMRLENLGNSIDVNEIRGWRFWAQFLGLGYTVGLNNMIFLPNAYEYLHSELGLLESKGVIPKGKEISAADFVNAVSTYGGILFNDRDIQTRNFNMAVSNGLRMLHDRKEIQLKYRNDIAVNWTLYESSFEEEYRYPVSSVIYQGLSNE